MPTSSKTGATYVIIIGAISIGTALGAVFHNIGAGIAVGAGIGGVIVALMYK